MLLGAGDRESTVLAATVPNAGARRTRAVRSVFLAGVLATSLWGAVVTEPLRPFRVHALDTGSATILRLGIPTGGGSDQVCAVRSSGRGACARYLDDRAGPTMTWVERAPIIDIVGNNYALTPEGRVFRDGTPPTGLAALDHKVVEQMVATWTFGFCARLHDGDVYCVAGDSAQLECDLKVAKGGAVPDLDDAVDIAAMRQTACALRKTGELRCWSLCDPSVTVSSPPLSSVVQIGAAWGQICARLGDGSVKCRKEDKPWLDISGIEATSIAVGDAAACATTKPHELWCWGRDVSVPDTLLRRLDVPPDFDHVVVGGAHVCFTSGVHVECLGPRP